GEESAQDRRVPDGVDRVADEVRLVLRGLEVDVPGEEPALPKGHDPFVDRIRDGDRVRVGLLADGELDRGHAVEPGPEPLLAVGVPYRRDLGEGNSPAAREREEEFADLANVLELAGGLADDLPGRGDDS